MSNTLAAIEQKIGPGKETESGEGRIRTREYGCGCEASTIDNNPQWNVSPCSDHIGADWL